MSIIIFSRPIHSGKTTMLMNWCKPLNNVHGILMPDINEQRMFFSIASQEIFAAQCFDNNTKEELMTIGKYVFFADAFKQANSILLKALDAKPEWLVIDEIGKLELQGKGFYEPVKLIIDYYIINHFEKTNFNLLLVVRDSLIDEVIDFFGIKEYVLINNFIDFHAKTQRK